LLFSLFIQEYRNGEKIKFLQKEVNLIKSSVSNNEESEVDNNQDINIDKYTAQVLQIGGTGSWLVQKQAYSAEEGYLHPAEDWVSTIFNAPADFMHVACKDGYSLISCSVDDIENKEIDDLGCAVGVQEKMKMTVGIECVKDN
jgi:hypothetical protein